MTRKKYFRRKKRRLLKNRKIDYFRFAIYVLIVVALIIAALMWPSPSTKSKKSLTIDIYSEFECPYSGKFYNGAYKQIVSQYSEKAKITFKHFPLSFHKNAQKAAEASECARDQGKFWEYHNKLFDNQKALSIQYLKAYAKTLGLDTKKFDICLNSGMKAVIVRSNMKEGSAKGVRGTPSVFINGELVMGAQPFTAFKSVIDKKLTPSSDKNTGLSKKPKVEVFVMSHCPYGTQIEKGLLPVMEKLKGKVDFEIKFCDYVMHGKKEVSEQLAQYCIQKEFSSKFIGYLKCFLDKGDSTTCIKNTGIDSKKLNTCIQKTDAAFKVTKGFADKSTWKGGRYPGFDVFKADNTKYNVRGSPTLLVNGKSVSSKRDSASLLQTICSSFTTPPKECKDTLSSAAPSPGFGFGTTSSGAAGGCGA